MKKLDRYLLKEFSKYFIIFLFGIIFLYIVVDFFEKIDRFLKAEVPFFVIIKYYLYQVPDLYVLLLPASLLLTPFFSISNLARKKEIVAMKASGINLTRLSIPIISFGFFLTLSSFIDQEFIKPLSQKKFIEINYKHIKKIPPPGERIYGIDLTFLEKRGKNFYIFGYISSKEEYSKNIIILTFEKNRLLRRIDAESGIFEGNGWRFYEVMERIFDEGGDIKYVRKYNEKFYDDLKSSPLVILREEKTIDQMNIFEILSLIRSKKDAGMDFSKEIVEAHSRISFPLVSLLTLFFALPLSFTLEKGGRSFAFALGSFVSFIYWGIMEVSRALGETQKLPPPIAPWIPNIIFFIAGVIVLIKIRK
ncbi:MAG: LptF/LptG family permease [candidate division WOR-3 bacterium]